MPKAKDKPLSPEKAPSKDAQTSKYSRAAFQTARVAEQALTFGKESTSHFDVAGFCKKYALKRDLISRMTSYAPRTIAAWAAGKSIHGAAVQKVTELKRLTAALEQLVKAESIGPWFRTPNPAFEGSTPAQLVERGESDRIWRMIHLLESGQPG